MAGACNLQLGVTTFLQDCKGEILEVAFYNQTSGNLNRMQSSLIADGTFPKVS